MSSLYFEFLVILYISRLVLRAGIRVLIASVPDLCILFSFADSKDMKKF